MPISIKNEQTEQLARQVAKLTGQSITQAIGSALADKFERLRREKAGQTLAEELHAIGVRCSKLPEISTLTDDEILGYDEMGIPTK